VSELQFVPNSTFYCTDMKTPHVCYYNRFLLRHLLCRRQRTVQRERHSRRLHRGCLLPQERWQIECRLCSGDGPHNFYKPKISTSLRDSRYPKNAPEIVPEVQKSSWRIKKLGPKPKEFNSKAWKSGLGPQAPVSCSFPGPFQHPQKP
jgi:hypothetical protein